ncbi:acyl-CoA dehydrogenase family protein [Aeromicrobium sp.]|uniref:acyl-CoA dehydrogenase family protein n=1 Tax=Aeromicrobium sp. TaxID=1871063 RepID=UPI0019AEC4DD|nr:acyl-CoA dehydrogenase family protein [Aeromicrobium sp.]MBC7630381.1 acyl-CoA dehydrogenase family protein [Aeromicrobium sp.]
MSSVLNAASPAGTQLTDPLERARSMAGLVQAEAATTQAEGRISQKVIDALHDVELFWFCVPTELGGEDATMLKRFEVFEEMASQDASTGWSYMTLAGFNGYSSVGLGDDAVRELFVDSDLRALTSGFAGPSGIAKPVEGGYRITGKYQFGSGVLHATHFAAGAFIEGTESIITGFVPRDQVTVVGGWDVFGLQGSGSVDFEVEDVFVPSQYAFSPVEYVSLRGGAAGRMDFGSTAIAYHSAVACGIAKHALQEIVKIADAGRQVVPHGRIIDEPRFAYEFAHHESRLAAVRALTLSNIENARVKIESGEEMDELDRARFYQAGNLVHQVVREVAEFAFSWAGTSPVREGSVLGRALLDSLVAQQHAHVDHHKVVEAAPAVINHYRVA